jgi:hypothetical protein
LAVFSLSLSFVAPHDILLICFHCFYKELQQLGEAIGTESRGLPDDMIRRLPKSNYKAGGIFSRKEKYEEYVLSSP